MASRSFTLSSDTADFTGDFTSDFTTCYSSPIILDPGKKYEAALFSIDIYNSIPNIKSGENDLFMYSIDNGNTWKNISLGTGSFELSTINNEIQRQMVVNGDYNENSSFYINIEPNISKLTSTVIITHASYQVDFRKPNTIGPLLGFLPTILKHGYNESSNIVDIMSVNSILVNVDIISGSYVNKHALPVIFSFFSDVDPPL